MDIQTFILVTLGMIVVTFSVRFSFIGLGNRIKMPERFKKTLRFVPVTVLPAIIVVEVLGVGEQMSFSLQNPRLLAALVATIVSFRYGLAWVVLSGIGSLLLFQFLLL